MFALKYCTTNETKASKLTRTAHTYFVQFTSPGIIVYFASVTNFNFPVLRLFSGCTYILSLVDSVPRLKKRIMT